MNRRKFLALAVASMPVMALSGAVLANYQPEITKKISGVQRYKTFYLDRPLDEVMEDGTDIRFCEVHFTKPLRYCMSGTVAIKNECVVMNNTFFQYT